MCPAIEVGEEKSPHWVPGEDINCTTLLPPLCFVLLKASRKHKKQPETRFFLLLRFHYRCMLSSTVLQREIKQTFRPWFIYDCAIWALPTLEMQMERPRNFVSLWEHREHFNLTVLQLLTPPDATRRSYRATVSSYSILRFIDNVFFLVARAAARACIRVHITLACMNALGRWVNVWWELIMIMIMIMKISYW